jgi:hypothetical protein
MTFLPSDVEIAWSRIMVDHGLLRIITSKELRIFHTTSNLMNPVQAMRLIITGCSTDHRPDCLLDTKLFEESMWPIQACSASAAVS